MIELFERELKDDGRRSSKGNQLKWERNGIWYKTDYLGYEGLAEYVVSSLLKRSSLKSDEFVCYEPETIVYKTKFLTGCKSSDFAGKYRVITLERLFTSIYGVGLNKGIYSVKDHKHRLKFLVDQVERTTGLKNFGIYMSKLFTLDAFFLNEDRHTHNISVLMENDSEFKLCPIYDNGAALLSDTMFDYPLGCDIYREKDRIRTKTICDSPDEQMEIAESMYGQHIHFDWNEKDVTDCLEGASIYSKEIRDRVKDLLLEQKRKYAYLF